jgi:hypothetical protein
MQKQKTNRVVRIFTIHPMRIVSHQTTRFKKDEDVERTSISSKNFKSPTHNWKHRPSNKISKLSVVFEGDQKERRIEYVQQIASCDHTDYIEPPWNEKDNS